MVPLFLMDTTFVLASMLEIVEGAWLPVLVGAALVMIMYTWRRGTRLLATKTRRVEVPFEPLIKSLEAKPPHVVPGTAVFLTSDPDFAPTALLHNLKHNKVLHEHNVILTIVNEDIPRVAPQGPRADRADQRQIHAPGSAFRLHGEAERAEGLGGRAQARLAIRHHVDVVLPVAPVGPARPALRHAEMAGRAYIFLAHNADDASSYFQLPTDRVVEIGTQVTV